MTDPSVPDWFLEAFRDAASDLFADLDATTGGEYKNERVAKRCRQLWFAVVANQQVVSTAVDDQTGRLYPPFESTGVLPPAQAQQRAERVIDESPRFGMPEAFDQFDPVAAGPWGQLDDTLRRPPSVPRDVGTVVRPYAQGMYVTREAADLSVPKLGCPDCAASGEWLGVDGGMHPCTTCKGTGEVPAPVAPPSETGAVPEDSPFAQPLTAEELAAVDVEQAPPEVVAAQVAAAKAGLDRMKSR